MLSSLVFLGGNQTYLDHQIGGKPSQKTKREQLLIHLPQQMAGFVMEMPREGTLREEPK